MGFRLIDFGTGYPSLASTQAPAATSSKSTKALCAMLTDPNDAAIARTIVALGTTCRAARHRRGR